MSFLRISVCRKVGNVVLDKGTQPWKDIENPDTIETCKYFESWNYDFHKHRKFILI